MTTPATSPSRWPAILTEETVREYLALGPRSLSRAIRDGAAPPPHAMRRDGRVWLRTAVDAWLAERMLEPDATADPEWAEPTLA